MLTSEEIERQTKEYLERGGKIDSVLGFKEVSAVGFNNCSPQSLQIKHKYRQGKSIALIAKQLNITKERVREVLNGGKKDYCR